MRIAILILAVCLSLFASELKPKKTIKLNAPALDLTHQGSTLFASTANGDILEIGKEVKKLYSLPYFTTSTGEKRAQKAFSLAFSPTLSVVAIASEEGRLYIGKNKTLTKSSFVSDSVIKKVVMLDENLVLMGLVSSQIALFDISKNKTLYWAQIGSSPLSDIALSPDKKSVVVVGESGFIYILDPLTGKQKALYKNINLDNIYKVDYQNGMIVTAGQDRRVTLLTDKGVVKTRFEADFLVYAAALSPSAKFVVAATNDQNDLAVFDSASKTKIGVAKGHGATLNRIVFLGESEFASCADENKILIWSVK